MGTLVAGAIVLVMVILAVKSIKKDGLKCPGCSGDCSGNCCSGCSQCNSEHHTEK